MLTRSNGKIILLVGKIEGMLWPLGVEKKRYKKPVMAAKDDCMVFKTSE
jgi:hypothetical protein